MLYYNTLIYCIQYLKEIKNKQLLFKHRNYNNITSYINTDRIIQENNKVISKYTFFLRESLIYQSSKGQKLVSLFMYKAELIVLLNRIQEAIVL